MKKYVLIASVVLVLGASPAYAQAGAPEVAVPGDPPPTVSQYGGDPSEGPVSNDGIEEGLGDAAGGIGSGGEPTTTQSIEEGLEDAVEDVEPGSGNEAVVGTGSYLDSLTDSEPVTPVEAAEPSDPEAAHDKPSDTYTELPDTGGFPLAGLVGFVVGIAASTGLMLRSIEKK